MKVESYFLDLDVDYASESFRGDLTIRLASDAERVELDAVELEVHDTWVGGTLAAHRYDAAGGKLTIELLRAGDLDVRITYSGKVRKDVLNGFYVSASGEKPLFTTMMEPVGCRRLLPCLDAPNQKAVFRLRVTTDPSLMVLSNAAVESNELWEGRRRWTFAPTPRMSTYLLYLGIGPFETIETVDDGIRIIAAAGPGKAEQARKGLELAGPLLRAYGEFYGIRYPLPKLHLIAVPDLWAGGMENWGAIVFPELGLLWDGSTSPAVVRWAVETMAHEVAHQWFGNLVTMETFNDLWL
ncbi:MAG: M1 family metallopeptidase, partial [Thermoplasmata archaeon]|nr:M1 family metallopeptidase [Thermoplasmata archaeon]